MDRLHARLRLSPPTRRSRLPGHCARRFSGHPIGVEPRRARLLRAFVSQYRQASRRPFLHRGWRCLLGGGFQQRPAFTRPASEFRARSCGGRPVRRTALAERLRPGSLRWRARRFLERIFLGSDAPRERRILGSRHRSRREGKLGRGLQTARLLLARQSRGGQSRSRRRAQQGLGSGLESQLLEGTRSWAPGVF